jgi:hypothetical protein
MQYSFLEKLFSFTTRNLLSVLCCFLIITAMWLGVYLDNSLPLVESAGIRIAAATTMNGALANQPIAMNELKDKVRNDLRDSNKSTVSHPNDDFAQGKVSKVQDKPESDRVTEEAEKLGASVDGRSRENVEQVRGDVTRSRAINNPEGKVEDAIEEVMGNIKDALN